MDVPAPGSTIHAPAGWVAGGTRTRALVSLKLRLAQAIYHTPMGLSTCCYRHDPEMVVCCVAFPRQAGDVSDVRVRASYSPSHGSSIE
jgi:hypothetical protein